MTVAEMLAQFHAALDEEPGRGDAALRTTLHCEEHAELLAELHNLRSLEDGGVAMSGVPQSRERLARELADLVYLAYGTAHRSTSTWTLLSPRFIGLR